MRRAMLWLAPLMLLAALPLRAEVRRLEVVGVVPAGTDASPDVPVRQAALQAALAQGVERVARDLLSAEAAADPDLDLAAVLGGNPRDFTVRYRVLEDRGERRALLLVDPEVATEYVLMVEVFVDASRIQSALGTAGLLVPEPVAGGNRVLTVVVEDVPSYRALTALRSHLLAQRGVTSVVPALFEARRVELRVAATRSAAELMDRLVTPPPAGLRVDPLFADGESMRIRVVELPGALED